MSKLKQAIVVGGIAVIANVGYTQDNPLPNTDILTSVMAEFYPKKYSAFAPYLCEYNLAHPEPNGIKDCQNIQPGERILLPSERVIYCTFMKDLKMECNIPMESYEESWQVMRRGLDPMHQSCFDYLIGSYPEMPIAYLTVVTKEIGIGVKDKKETLQETCVNKTVPEACYMLENWDEQKEMQKACFSINKDKMQKALGAVRDCFVTIDENGQLEFTGIFGCPYMND